MNVTERSKIAKYIQKRLTKSDLEINLVKSQRKSRKDQAKATLTVKNHKIFSEKVDQVRSPDNSTNIPEDSVQK